MSTVTEQRITELAAHIHAATAGFVELAAELDRSDAWRVIGMQSCAHWLSIFTGIELWNARSMVQVGHALQGLPLIRTEFAAGRLSFDKVRSLTTVATAADEAIWLDVALEGSGAQLANICRQFRRSIAIDDPGRSATQRARRRVVSWWLDDSGMLSLYATLPPEEGRMVLTAIESAVVRPAMATNDAATGDAAAPDPCAEQADHPHGALRADALVRICERWLDEAASPSPSNPALPELVVHVDAALLDGTGDGGRCHVDGGPALSTAAARRLACDASVVTVLERDGNPFDVGRSQRVVSGRLRRLLHLRDQGCRYPGCWVPAEGTEGHHVVHWIDGGRTDLANLVSLCRFHHHRHHEGAFRILALASPASGSAKLLGETTPFRFEACDGRVIGPPRASTRTEGPRGAPWLRANLDAAPSIDSSTPTARDGGRPFDLHHAIVVLAANIASAARRAVEQSASP